VFATKETLNPSTSVKMVDTVSEVFGALESTKAFAGVEAEGHRLRRGDDVVSPSDVKRVCDRSLTNEDGCKNKCVGFLDTSTSVEKTSFVILAEDPESEFPWEHIYLSHLKYWWPGVNTKAKYIDGNEVKRYLENLLPLYPNLQIFEVDTKVGAVKKDKGLEAQWPVQMMRDIRKLSGKWVGKVKTWKGGGSESQTGWDLLEERILRQTILLQDVKAIKDEFKGVKRGAPKEGKRKVEDRKRDKMHRDITEGIACSCYRIGILKMRAFSGMSMAAIRQKTTRTPKDQLEKRRREEMSPRPLRFRPRGDPDQY